jgi:galactokinase
MVENLKKEFERIFIEGGELHAYFAPGRVNLIGEHTTIMAGTFFHVL